jgi:hypothetical protein
LGAVQQWRGTSNLLNSAGRSSWHAALHARPAWLLSGQATSRWARNQAVIPLLALPLCCAGKRQFAAVQGGLLAWDFELKDEQGGTLALIDRNFYGG